VRFYHQVQEHRTAASGIRVCVSTTKFRSIALLLVGYACEFLHHVQELCRGMAVAGRTFTHKIGKDFLEKYSFYSPPAHAVTVLSPRPVQHVRVPWCRPTRYLLTWQHRAIRGMLLIAAAQSGGWRKRPIKQQYSPTKLQWHPAKKKSAAKQSSPAMRNRIIASTKLHLRRLCLVTVCCLSRCSSRAGA
jgi:hypothetical protein